MLLDMQSHWDQFLASTTQPDSDCCYIQTTRKIGVPLYPSHHVFALGSVVCVLTHREMLFILIIQTQTVNW